MTSFGADDAGEHPQQGTLTGAIVANEAVDFPGFHRKRHSVQGREISEYFRDLNGFQPAFQLRDHGQESPISTC